VKIQTRQIEIMKIQINTGKNLTVHAEYGNELEALLKKELSRYSEHITRLEVHLSDENGTKESLNDKKCLLEARLEGRQPLAVSASSNTYDQAVNSAVGKLKALLDTIIGKLRDFHKD
jgi:hypothetical protein